MAAAAAGGEQRGSAPRLAVAPQGQGAVLRLTGSWTIAFGPGGGDPPFDFRHLFVLQFVDLGFELVVTGPGHRYAFRHGIT